MPQPATHYLVARFSIPADFYELWDQYKNYFGLGSSLPDLFYFPMVPVVGEEDAAVNDDIDWENLANDMHSDKTYDLFCSMLDYAKKIQLENPEQKDKYLKLFAVAFGLYSHVVADCIFHPYVYRSTGDFWHSKTPLGELKHKQQEAYIDSSLFKNFYSDKNSYSRMKIICDEPQTELLDFDVAKMLSETLTAAYPSMEFFNQYDYTADSHPLQIAYIKFKATVSALFQKRDSLMLWGQNAKQAIMDIVHLFTGDFFEEPYPDAKGLSENSPRQLFIYSVIVCHKIFSEAMQFINSSQTSSHEYFAEHNTHYLNAGNFNLDTGLLAAFNNEKALLDNGDARYNFHMQELNDAYNYFKEESNLLHKILLAKHLIKE